MTYTILFKHHDATLNYVSNMATLESARLKLQEWTQYAKPGDSFHIVEGEDI